VIELGGNITLHGFKDRDYAELIVIKKIVGRYTRQLSDTHAGFQALSVTLSQKEGKHLVTASCTVKEKRSDAAAEEQNLFVALDSALKKMVQAL